jgi:hypothetical protein
MIGKGKKTYLVALIVFAALTLTFRPGIWLVHKPASTQSAQYVKGWEDGCTSGTNSYSLLFAPLLDKPFIKDIEAGMNVVGTTKGTADRDNYKGGWNEGFTLCRFYQSSVYELMQFTLIITTLLFIGYQLARKRV